DWPGNVRELENVVQRAVVLSRGGEIGSADLSFGPGGSVEPALQDAEAAIDAAEQHLSSLLANRRLDELEREAILATVAAAGGNKTEAARRLGVTARTLSNKYRHWRAAGLVD
ncbi:MAG: helix-turn-helix domain-containing protein, partial [Planctomycetota bacterium]